MQLELGGLETIESPTEENVRHHLKYMPIESPFVILSDDQAFMQAIFNGEKYQVEYRLDDECPQYLCLVDYDSACKLLLDFHAGKSDYQNAVNWRRLTFLNTPNHPVVLVALCTIGLLSIAGMIWLAFN